MRIVCMANNAIGATLTRWLIDRGEDVVGLVVHPDGQSRCMDRVISAMAPEQVIVGDSLGNEHTLKQLKEWEADIAVSILFDYILRPEVIQVFPDGVINLHPSYLPYNRGQYPNVWSIVENTPAGVTMHYVDEGIDTGDVIAQRKISVDATDTGESLYRKLEVEMVSLFKGTWEKIRTRTNVRVQQPADKGTSHRTRDVNGIDCIDRDKIYRAGDLIDVLRARTFPPYRGAYFEVDGKRVYLRLQLDYGTSEDS